MNDNFKIKIDQFGEQIDKLDEKLIEEDSQGQLILGSNFSIFRLKLPDQIDEFNDQYTDYIDTIKHLLEKTDEV